LKEPLVGCVEVVNG